ncbi:Na+/H+ antiporter subunit E [Rhizobium grahamii]|uniref:Cation transporter n=1 Tax=Rhizobium grahamii TaxID=1120045 RepID=A0A370KNZ1_9HYPH|nr:Na+/H+ antiporter subunit E [Rhizobium grahamii]RDJ10576.1 cation transporter [Rhizobium grahamii]
MPEDQATPQPRPSGLPQGVVLLASFLFVVWLVVNSSVEAPIVAIGAVVSFVLAWIFARRGDVWKVTVTPAKVVHFIAYTGVFLVELVKANLNMLRYVYAPRIVIRPGIVKVRMPLTSPIGRLVLANSIALTPGSLVMDLRGDALFIHWLDVKTTDPEEATRMIIGPFEKHLGAVFG